MIIGPSSAPVLLSLLRPPHPLQTRRAMSPTQTKTAVADHVRSPDRELTPAPAKLRSPSPPALAQSRGASLAPASPKSAAARLTSPAPEPSSRATPAPEPTLAPPVKDEPADASADADDADDEVRPAGTYPFRAHAHIALSRPPGRPGRGHRPRYLQPDPRSRRGRHPRLLSRHD